MSLLPNHWVILRAPIGSGRRGRVTLRFWSWGADYRASWPGRRFARCYYGALVADEERAPGSVARAGVQG